MAASSERKLRSALAALRAGLNETRAPWMVIGGIAVIAQGVRRTTTDIDVALRAEGIDLGALVKRLGPHGIHPRIDDAVDFARKSQVLLLEHTPTGVELDLSLAWLSFEHEALGASVRIRFAGVEAPAARPEDLVIYKVFAGRPEDLSDAKALLLMHKRNIDMKRVRRVLSQLGELADAPEIVDRLDAIGATRKKSRRRRG